MGDPRYFRIRTGYVEAALFDQDGLLAAADTGDARILLPGGFEISATTAAFTASSPAIFHLRCARDSSQLRVERRSPLVVHLSMSPDQVGVSLPYVTYTLLELVRHRSSLITLRAAGIGAPNGEAILLLGDKGAGKTITTNALVARGFAAFGDELLILRFLSRGVIELLPGNRLSFVRATSGKATAFERKSRRVFPARRFAAGATPLRHAFRLNVHPSVTSAAIFESQSPLRESLRLTENLGRYIRGLPTAFCMEDGVVAATVPSLDDSACARLRCQWSANLLRLPLLNLAAGSAETAADLIEQHCL